METKPEQQSPSILDSITQQKIEYRLNQSNGSRLAEVITGFTPEDPKIIDRLIEIQDRIYQNRSLPDIALSITNPNLLSQQINQILTKNNIPLLTKKFTSDKFDKYPEMYAAYFPDLKGIGINTEKQKDPNYNDLLYYMTLLHETTHALQYQSGDSNIFGIEMLEFEATIAANTLSPLKDLDYRAKVPYLKEAMIYLFDSMYASIENWEEQGGCTNRLNYTAENMLKVFDGITTDQLKPYQNQLSPSK